MCCACGLAFSAQTASKDGLASLQPLVLAHCRRCSRHLSPDHSLTHCGHGLCCRPFLQSHHQPTAQFTRVRPCHKPDTPPLRRRLIQSCGYGQCGAASCLGRQRNGDSSATAWANTYTRTTECLVGVAWNCCRCATHACESVFWHARFGLRVQAGSAALEAAVVRLTALLPPRSRPMPSLGTPSSAEAGVGQVGGGGKAPPGKMSLPRRARDRRA